MALQKEQIAGLDDLNNRIASGYKANAQDQANLDYGKSKGYTYNPIPQGATKIAGPSGLQGLNESQLFRQGTDIYKLPDVAQSLSSGQITGGVSDIQAQEPVDMFDTSVAGNQAYQNQLNTELAQTIADQKEIELQAQQSVSGLDKYKELLGERAGDTQKELAKFDYEPTIKQLQDINKQASSLYSGFEKGIVGAEGRVASASSIYGRQALMRRQQAVEIGALTSMAQALQGNITLAEKTAERAINDKYGAIEQQLGIEMAQLDYIYKDLDRADKKRADTKLDTLKEREKLIANEKEKEVNISNLMISAAQNGASNDVLSKIMEAGSYMDAIKIGKDFLSADNTKWQESEILDADGNPMIFNPKTGEYKTSVGSSTSDIFFTDANGDSWNIAGWATDQTKPKQMDAIAKKIGKVTEENIGEKVKEFTPGLTADMIKEASAQSGVSWEAIMTMVNQEAQGGLSNVAKNNNNFGGLTFNNQEWIKPYGGKAGTARPSAEGGNYIQFPSKQQGLNAMAALMASYGKVDTNNATIPQEVVSLVDLVKKNELTSKEALVQVSGANKIKLTEELSKIDVNPIISDYNKDKAEMVIRNVDDLLKDVNPFNVGWGSLTKKVPTSSSLNFASRLETLKSGIAFRELTAMREASKTGGALGQVSDNEGRLLQNALGALNQAQTPEQFRAELIKVKESILRWQEAVGVYKDDNNISNTNLSDLNFVI